MIDQSQNKELLKGLEEFGLSPKEAAVYLALLTRQDTGSSKLVVATGLHKQFVYNALRKLEELGLAKHVIQNGRKKFSANAPMRILSLLEEKKLSAQTMVRQLQERYVGAHEQDFEVFQGADALAAHEFAMLREAPEGSSICVILGAKNQYWEIFNARGLADEYERIRREKKVTVRYIGSDTERQNLEEMKQKRWGWDYRTLSGFGTGVVDTDIWHDGVTFNIFGAPVLSFALTSKEAADGYREFFETLWKLSNE